MRLLPIFLALVLLTGVALGGSAPLNKDVATPIKSDIGSANRLGWISNQTIPAAESSDDDQLVNGASLNSTTPLALDPTRSQFLDDPDVPRCLLVTPSDVVTSNIKVTGKDIAGSIISEWFNFSASSTALIGTRAFENVTMINATTTGTTRTVKIGTSDKLGLNTKLTVNTVLMAFLGGTREGTAPTVTVSGTVLSQNTVDLSSSLNGKIIDVLYIV